MISIGTLCRRAALIQAVRDFFTANSYLEVDTPVRIPAPAPEMHIEPEPAGAWFLQTSPEICMKRLLAGGIPRIFQICRCFRRHERGRRHLPEFTMLEWYRAAINFHDLMAETEALIRYAAEAIGIGGAINVSGYTIDLNSPWERLSLKQAFDRHARIGLREALERGLFEEILVSDVEPLLGIEHPAFLFDYPASLGSLARLKPDEPDIAERCELYIGGIEVANGFTELTDPGQQRMRFDKDRDSIARVGREPGPMPERFLEELGRMPESAGIALGIDRLAMVFFGAETIDEVVTFTPEDL